MKVSKIKLFIYIIVVLLLTLGAFFSYRFIFGWSSYGQGFSQTANDGSGDDYYQYPSPFIHSPAHGEVLSGSVAIEIYSPGASWVRYKIWDVERGLIVAEANANQGTTQDMWFNHWNTQSTHDGVYNIVAVSYFPNATYSSSELIEVVVVNGTASDDSTYPGGDSSDGSGNTTTDPNNTSSTPSGETAADRQEVTSEEKIRESKVYEKFPELINAPVSKKIKIEEAKVKLSDNGKGKVTIRGKADPNTELVLYIFSDPIVVSVKTDNDGNWSYTLDDPLDEGEHEVYVAIKEEDGSISERSNSFSFFVGQAAAATESDFEESKETMDQSNNYLLYYLLSGALIVILVLSTVLVWKFKKHVNIDR